MLKRKGTPGQKLEGGARELVTHLDRAMRRLVLAGNEQGIPESFSRSEIAVLDTVGAEGPMTMGVIAARVRMPLSTVTRVVDRLVVRELVQRERPEDNRRVVRVALAPDGHSFYQAALRSRIAGAQRMLQRLTEGEQRELVRLFRKIADSIAEEPQG
ncbi:MAG: MarR family transcriptional regulator [Deltaproteobacteria bacterium]|nr:MarR family transcriptional regulator [Deltaproteobacteria bacterium]